MGIGTTSTRELVSAMKEFKHEVKIQKKWASPYLVKLIGLCMSPLAIAFELCPFGNLYSAIHDFERPFSWGLTVKFALDVAKALDYLHGE